MPGGVTAALYAREKAGKGQVVDTSLMGSVIAMLAFIMEAPAILDQEFPWDFNDTPALWRRKAPAFGKHTEEILLALDYSQDDVACLKTEGVVE